MHHTTSLPEYQALEEAVTLAITNKLPMTLTYLKENGMVTVRTVEPYDVGFTKRGDEIIRVLERASKEPRTFRVDRIDSYTLHRRGHRLLKHEEDDGHADREAH